MSTTANQGGAVTRDQGRNKAFVWYFLALLAGGGGLIAAGATDELGGWSIWVGGLLALTGGMSLISMRMTGGAGLGACPACGAGFKLLHLTQRRILPCPGCHRWLHGAERMTLVPEAHLEKFPVFEAPIPEPVRWPDGCPSCGGAVTREVKIEGVDALGFAVASIAPVGVHRVSKLDAPACAEHDDGVGLFRAGSATFIAFRSLDYWRRFCELNQIAPAAASAAYWKRNDVAV